MAAKKKPTIDERLEALTQTVELLAHLQKRTEVEIEKMAHLARSILTNHNKRITRLEKGRA